MFDIIYRYDPNHSYQREVPADAAGAIQLLEEGNRLFASIGTAEGSRIVHMDLADVGMTPAGSVPKQQPFAVVLGCADARVPTEMVFDCTCNELFVVRVAGNIISEELLGSIDYAVDHMGHNLKVIVVLGHSQCGAVTVAVDAFLKPSEYLGFATAHHVRAIINTLFPAVSGAVRALLLTWGTDVEKMPGYRAALIETSVIVNAALMASILRKEFGEVRSVCGMYDLGTRCVHVPRSANVENEIGLMDAPSGVEEFRRFASEVAASNHILKLLQG
jgi:carbonic anhydrase